MSRVRVGVAGGARPPIVQGGRPRSRTETENMRDDRMTDFRIELPERADSYFHRELEWDNKEGSWSLAEKEYGDVRWTQHHEPRPEDWDSLCEFFEVSHPRDPDILRTLSPGKLTQIHHDTHAERNVLAVLCESCGEHWTVYKRGEAENWRRYGRSCGFKWDRGALTKREDDAQLDKLLREQRGAEK